MTNSTARSDSDLQGGGGCDTLVDRLRSQTFDWNGSEMADEAPSLHEIKCGLLREAAARIEAVEAAQLNLVRRGDHFRNAGIERAAALVEEMSKRPATRWGEIVTAIRALKVEAHDGLR
jgi:hypothetical protein